MLPDGLAGNGKESCFASFSFTGGQEFRFLSDVLIFPSLVEIANEWHRFIEPGSSREPVMRLQNFIAQNGDLAEKKKLS